MQTPLRLKPTLAVALLLGTTIALAAQSAPANAPAPQTAASPKKPQPVPTTDETVTLNPFEVQSSRDNGYGALQSNSLSAFSMDVQKMPATAQIFTETFMKDTNSDLIEDMLINYSGVVGYAPGDSAAYTESSGDRDGGGGLSVRGFGGTPVKLDGFFGPPSSTRSAAGTTPTFMLEGVEVVEGPQSLLYGAIGAGGVINGIYKRASFNRNFGSGSYSFNDLGGKKGTVDYNTAAGNFALRFSATSQSNATVRQNLGNTTKGFYVQGAWRLPKQTVIRVIHNKYETFATNGFNPSLKPFLASTSPLINRDARYIAATGQIPDSMFGGRVNWNNIDSFAGVWGLEPSSISNSSLEVASSPLPWLSVKLVGIYNQYVDWRNTTGMTLQPAGVGGNPYPTAAIALASPNLNYQSQRQRGVQLNFLATNDFFHGNAHSQTLLNGYVQHIGPSFGSSGITYSYIQANSDWTPFVGTGVADYGHVLMPTQWIPVTNGQIVKYGAFNPTQNPDKSRVTINGVNYILQPRIMQSAAYKGFAIPGNPANTYGLIPNGSNSVLNPKATSANYNFNGSFNPGTEEHEHFVSLANYTDWFGGRFSTLAGMSLDRAITQNTGATAITVLPWTTYTGFEVGGIYQVTKNFGAYVTLGTAATPAGSTNNLYGQPLATPKAKSPVPEIGIKAHTLDQRYTAQLSWDVKTKDTGEIQSVDSSYQNAVNPNGINGRLGAPVGAASQTNNFVNVDRTATSLEFLATASPTQNWRMRFNASYLFARILNGVTYKQLYNDQFNASGSGQVTYGNGQVIYVNGAATNAATANIVTSSTAGATPLTLALLNNSASPYWANPDPTSGTITNSALKTILTTGGAAGSTGVAQVTANGQSATGAVGLPLSSVQYAFTSLFPNATVPIFKPGDPTTGYAGWQMNASTDYRFSEGLLKGFGVSFSARAQFSTRALYTFYPNTGLGTAGSQVVNENRVIVVLPTIVNCDVGVHYEHKLWHGLTLSTRLFVSNVFNNDRFYVLPQAANGNFLQVTQRLPTRLWTLSNEISF